MYRISLVTDSTADLSDDIRIHYDIQVIPNLIILNGKTLRDGTDITREEFYSQLPKATTFPTTATASSGTYHKVYSELFSKGAEHILSIHPPTTLSGIINAAHVAAEGFGDKIHILDSGQVSLGLGFQVLTAAELIHQGARLEMVLNILSNIQQKIHVVAMLDTLEYLRRSGRVSWARARLGNLLQIKPFVELKNGIVSSLGEARTRSKGIQRLKNFLTKIGGLERLAILHTNAQSDAEEFLNNLQVNLETEPFIVNVSTVIGSHLGPNGLGFAAVAK